MHGHDAIRADIAGGALARMGLLDDDAQRRAAEVVAEVRQTGLETVRVLFADQHGILRGKTVTAAALPSVFRSGLGMPSTLLLKDTAHRTVFPVWDGAGDSPMRGASDVLLVPDPASFRVIPWAPHSAFLLGDVVQRDGGAIPFTSGAVLDRAVRALATHGWDAVFGLEVEFQVFQVTDPALAHEDTTMPPRPPQTRALTQGFQFLTETRYAEAETLLDALRRNAQGLGMPVRSVEIEMGPSQFEFTFDPADAATQADLMVLFRTMVKEVCHAQGLHASFMAKPKLPNAVANGWHIHQSLVEAASGRNLFTPDAAGGLTPQAEGWIAGLLHHAEPSCLLTTPTVNGYKRYGPYQLAPNRIQWGQDNRGAMVRALLTPGDAASRVENRVADTTANPYYAFAAQIHSGLDGIERGMTAPAPSDRPYDDNARHLPDSLISAIDAFQASEMYRTRAGADFVDYYARIKRAEWQRYITTVSEWEQTEYFGTF